MLKFSVIIPCFNCEGTLAGAVESVRASGLADFEIVLVNDGSTDGTAELCDKLCEKYAEARRVHQSNAGVSAARNRGLDEARGEYILFFDADDAVDDGALKRAASIIDEEEPDMLIFGMLFEYYRRGKCYRKDAMVYPRRGSMAPDEINRDFRELYNRNALTSSCNKIYKKAALDRSGARFRENMPVLEDFMFVLEALPGCAKAYSLPEAVYRYRQTEDGENADKRLRCIDDLAEYIRPVGEKLRELGVARPDELEKSVYKTLLTQRLCRASIREIGRIIETHESGRYAELPVGGSAMGIYLKSRGTRLRHRVAVAVKSSWLYMLKNGGEPL